MKIDHWEEALSPFGDTDLDIVTSEDDWTELDDLNESEEDLVAPSEEEITALMSQIVASAPTIDDSPTPKTPPTEIEQVDRTTIQSLDPELREAFLDDATSCVGSIEQSLFSLENDPADADALNQICRELHTLKGASASVGLSDLADQLHRLEDVLDSDQQSGRSPDINSLFRTVDSIRSQVSGDPAETAESFDSPSINAPVAELAESFDPRRKNISTPPAASPKNRSLQHGREELSGGAQAPPSSVTVAAPEGLRPAAKNSTFTGLDPGTVSPSTVRLGDEPADDELVRVKSSQLNRLMDMLAQLVMLRNRRQTELSDLQEIYHELIGSVSKMRLLSNETDPETAVCSSLQLSEVANDVLEVAQQVRDCSAPIADGNTAVSQFIREFRQELVELRRTPISALFRRLQRVVRDAATAENKEVKLELVGENAGIERSLQQRLYEPLLHIVRNSVCHGIESPEDRVRQGKDRWGRITLKATSGPDLFVIEVCDDGGGLDYQAIRRRGVESGLLSADQNATEHDLSQLIFQPGFSTRQTADQVAGRGVGMDVVATTLQRMRGWLDVDSEAKRGTRIRLSFPLPSVIQHAMVFRAGDQLFALPMQSVQATGEISDDPNSLVFAELIEGATIPSAQSCQRIVLTSEISNSDRRRSPVTLLVNEIIGPEELVVRPLPALLKHHPYCCGASLSGMGKTVLFLDARRVVESQKYRLRQATDTTDLRHPTATRNTTLTASSRPRILVVDDSISARKCVVRSLRRYPVEIVEACDGKQALEILKGTSFDAIFSDMEMPHVSGMELLADVNGKSRVNAPPVVIISSRGEVEFTGRAKELGATNYLIKPLSDEALDEAIAGISTLKHLNLPQPIEPLSSGEML